MASSGARARRVRSAAADGDVLSIRSPIRTDASSRHRRREEDANGERQPQPLLPRLGGFLHVNPRAYNLRVVEQEVSMIRAAVVTVGVLAAVIFDSAPVQSHHSNVAYEVTKVITVTGVVKDFQWVNPHTWLHIVVDDPKDGKVEWAAEGRAPGILLRAGWTKTSLKAGETVTVDMSPAKDGSRTSIIARVTKADGTILSNQPRFDD